MEEHGGKLETHKIEVRAGKLKAEAAEKRARDRLKDDPNADVSDELNVAEPEEPFMRRYIANDTSAASLGELLRQNQNGLLASIDHDFSQRYPLGHVSTFTSISKSMSCRKPIEIGPNGDTSDAIFY